MRSQGLVVSGSGRKKKYPDSRSLSTPNLYTYTYSIDQIKNLQYPGILKVATS